MKSSGTKSTDNDLEKVKRIYLNTDGGSWIKAGMNRIVGITYVLDGFHLEKYLAKLTPHLKKERKEEVREEFRETIRKKTKKEFQEQVEKQKKEIQVKKMAYFNAHIWRL